MPPVYAAMSMNASGMPIRVMKTRKMIGGPATTASRPIRPARTKPRGGVSVPARTNRGITQATTTLRAMKAMTDPMAATNFCHRVGPIIRGAAVWGGGSVRLTLPITVPAVMLASLALT